MSYSIADEPIAEKRFDDFETIDEKVIADWAETEWKAYLAEQ